MGIGGYGVRRSLNRRKHRLRHTHRPRLAVPERRPPPLAIFLFISAFSSARSLGVGGSDFQHFSFYPPSSSSSSFQLLSFSAFQLLPFMCLMD